MATLEEFLLRYRTGPFERGVLQALRDENCAVTRLVPLEVVVKDAARGTWALLVKLPDMLANQFAVTREILLLSYPVEELQDRVRRHIEETRRWLLADAGRALEVGVVLIASRDRHAPEKVVEWSNNLETLIDFPPPFDDALAPHLASRLYARDLYIDLNPVTGPGFFGREKETAALTSAARRGAHVAIAGLRKVGKTSLLKAFESRMLQGRESLVLVLDLQTVADTDAEHAARSLMYRFQDLANRPGMGSWIGPTDDLVPSYARRRRGQWPADAHPIQDLADSLSDWLDADPDRSVCVVLDEIEVMFPFRADRPMLGALSLLRVLRGVSQETGRLSIILAGVTSKLAEQNVVGEQDNPMFGILEPLSVGPLLREDAVSMVEALGKRVGLRWSSRAVELLTEQAGFFPLLCRLAAADVADLIPIDARPDAQINREQVQETLALVPVNHSARFREMFDAVDRYYPEEADALMAVLRGDQDFVEIQDALDPDVLNHLYDIGLVTGQPPAKPRIAVPLLHNWLVRTRAVG